MPSRKQPVRAVSFEPVTRPGRIAKSKAGTTTRQVTSPTTRHLAAGAAPHDTTSLQPDTAHINSLVDGFEARFQEIDVTMKNNLLEMRQSNTDTFSQIMERVDAIYPPATTAVPPVTPTIEIGSRNILSRWAYRGVHCKWEVRHSLASKTSSNRRVASSPYCKGHRRV